MVTLYAGFAISADRLAYFIDSGIEDAQDRPALYFADHADRYAACDSTWIYGTAYQVTRLIGVLADHGEDVLRRVQERRPNLGDRIRSAA